MLGGGFRSEHAGAVCAMGRSRSAVHEAGCTKPRARSPARSRVRKGAKVYDPGEGGVYIHKEQSAATMAIQHHSLNPVSLVEYASMGPSSVINRHMMIFEISFLKMKFQDDYVHAPQLWLSNAIHQTRSASLSMPLWAQAL